MALANRAYVGLIPAAGAITIVVMGAAVAAPWGISERSFWTDFGQRLQGVQVVAEEFFEQFAGPAPEIPQAAEESVWLDSIGRGLLAVFLLIALKLLISHARKRIRLRRFEQLETTAPAIIHDDVKLPVLREGIADAEGFLAEIESPDDAIIAAWLALEEAAAATGVRRKSSQTPTELTVAVLERTQADPEAVGDLLTLFHRARFSSEAMGPQDVDRARQRFSQLARDWEALALVGRAR